MNEQPEEPFKLPPPAESPSAPEAPKTEQPKVSARARNKWWGRFFWSMLGGALLAGGLGGGLQLWQEVRTLRQDFARQSSGVENAIQTQVQPLAESVQTLRQEMEILLDRQNALESSTQELRDNLGRSASDFAAAEAEHLILLAGDRLLLERDVSTAVAALEAADRRLQSLTHGGALAVRKALASDIATLKALDSPDYAGLALRITELTRQTESLPFPSGAESLRGEPGPGAGEAGFWDKMWTELKTLVVIKRMDEKGAPLLPPDERYFLRQNLRLEIETARLALFKRDTAAFRSSVRTAREWIQHYFDASAPAAARALGELAEWEKFDLTPPLPESLVALQALRDWRAKGDKTPPPAARQPGHPPRQPLSREGQVL